MAKNADSGKSQKLFTQEEVNAIIKKRLERIKPDEAIRTEAPSADATFELNKREEELAKEKLTLECRNYLSTQGYDQKYMDFITADSLDDFKSSADMLNDIIERERRSSIVAPLAAPEVSRADPTAETIKEAFAPDRRHTPADPFGPIPTE